jgi:FMN-dependent NADH-azoreductase
MIEIRKLPWKELTMITGRKIAAMKYSYGMAKILMENEKEFMRKAQYVLDAIKNDKVIFPTPIITFEATATVIDRNGYCNEPAIL